MLYSIYVYFSVQLVVECIYIYKKNIHRVIFLAVFSELMRPLMAKLADFHLLKW